VQAQLTPEDSAKLESCLEDISIDWVQTSVDSANTILFNTEYDYNDWESFFNDYLSTHHFNYNLRVYLGYPVFFWGAESVHRNLQIALYSVIINRIDSTMIINHENMSNVLESDSLLKDDLANYHGFINGFLNIGIVDSLKNEAYLFFKSQMIQYPYFFQKSNTINTTTTPYIGWLRLQNYINFVESMKLVDTIKTDIAATIGLYGTYLSLWEDYGILLIDNNGFNNSSLEFIYNFLGSLPSGLCDLKNITVYYYLGNEGNQYTPTFSFSSINIFGTQIGEGNGNPFPDDVEPYRTSGLAQVLAHEYNHVVNVYIVDQNDTLLSREDSLLESACPDSMNFLRSMLPGNFFCEAPQEFVASISNQWFANSEHTLNLGVDRFLNGWTEPINQVIYFAEIYSHGSVNGDTTFFYVIDTLGNIERQEIPLERNVNGHIQAFQLSDTLYYFDLDIYGNVISLENPLDVDNESETELPYRFELFQNYPNPFNPKTKIGFSLPRALDVRVDIYNILGEKIKTIISEHLTAGYQSVTWNGTDNNGSEVSTGIYFYRIQANNFVDSKKMLLLK